MRSKQYSPALYPTQTKAARFNIATVKTHPMNFHRETLIDLRASLNFFTIGKGLGIALSLDRKPLRGATKEKREKRKEKRETLNKKTAARPLRFFI
ncbi:hypothetical protein ACJJID_19955 [Microbulbifer sp. CnH-101-G]|uniref:hypothetical protein n=1 Tax=Microbulbifer sp. CnH-101-G TaxID=3243393 RepID=UPI00403A528F